MCIMLNRDSERIGGSVFSIKKKIFGYFLFWQVEEFLSLLRNNRIQKQMYLQTEIGKRIHRQSN